LELSNACGVIEFSKSPDRNVVHALASGNTPRVKTSKAFNSYSLADIYLPVLQENNIAAPEHAK